MPTLKQSAQKWLKGALQRGGFDVVRSRKGYHFAPDYYGRSFGQREDIRETPLFSEIARTTIVTGRSCLYFDRLYVLFQALENLARKTNGPPVQLVEVGVYRGGTTAFLAEASAALGLRAEIHAFDTFEGHAAVDVVDGVDTVHRPGDFADTSYAAVREYLSPHTNISIYRGRFEDQCHAIAQRRLALMHLDVDLYGPTLHGLEFAAARLVVGGMCIVDDYQTKSCPGVKAAVAAFLGTHPEFTALHPLTEQCVLIRCEKA